MHLAKKKELVSNQLQEMIRLEKLKPYTLNGAYLTRIHKYKRNATIDEPKKNKGENEQLHER